MGAMTKYGETTNDTERSFNRVTYRTGRSLNRIDNSKENVQKMINQAINECYINPLQAISKDGITKITNHMGLLITDYQAFEAFLFSRQATRDE